LVGYSGGVDQTNRPKPGSGRRPVPTGKGPAKPLTKKQRRNQAAARSVSLEHRPPWQSPTVLTFSSVAVVAVVLIVIVLINAAGGGNATVLKPVPQAVLTAVQDPSASVVNAVGTGKQSGELVRLPASAKLTSNGKPEVVYVGAEYCPFCAAERWVMVMWLSRFGTFKNLSIIQSSSNDTDPNTSTFTFYKSSYSSPYIDFVPNEIEDRNQQPLMTMSSATQNLFTKYDAPPYTTLAQQFPFIDIGGLFTLYTTSYDPATLKNLSWQQIATKLSNPSDPVTQEIVGNANILTAATCIATGDQPASVCSGSVIQSIEPTLKAEKPPAG
jgi:thiol-disulfide isomerase/thioredoxin